MVGGDPADWANLLDPMVPAILRLVIDTWGSIPPQSGDETEDHITSSLCRALRQSRTARSLPLQIHTQQAELNPTPGQDMGRLDIVFNTLVPREDIYFCLEGKRLNVVKDGATRAYASEYVIQGMMRFVTGQYSSGVRHGGMIGYVLDGRIEHAIANVEANIKSRYASLRMAPPAALSTSTLVGCDARARETRHQRSNETGEFQIHHLFMSAT